jgi:hypothetical protein
MLMMKEAVDLVNDVIRELYPNGVIGPFEIDTQRACIHHSRPCAIVFGVSAVDLPSRRWFGVDVFIDRREVENNTKSGLVELVRMRTERAMEEIADKYPAAKAFRKELVA